MTAKEKAHLSGGPIPKHVLADIAESKPLHRKKQAESLAEVFGRGYVVVRQPLAESFRKRAPSRIRGWRAPA